MADKKKPLPEVSVSEGAIVGHAKEMANYRAQIADLQEKEDQVCGRIKTDAESLRQAELKRNNFVGLIRIVDDSMAPVRCEFRINKNGAFAVEDESKLDGLFGASRPLLFGKEKVITEITDPSALIEEIKARGQNPWDYLNISVKTGLDRALADSSHVISQEAFLPKTGFLATMNDIASTMKPESLSFVKEYLTKVLSAIVSMTKAKGDK
jgi:hypothetical protein